MHRRFYPGADGVERFAKIVGELYAQPVTRILSEIRAEVEVGFGGNTALFVDDFVDPLVRELRVFGEPVGGDTERRKELFAEKFAGVNVEVFSGSQ